MTNLKIVETTKNTEILENVMKKFDETYLRIRHSSNSVQIHRYVKSDEHNFQNVKTAINSLLGIKMKKERGSFDLIETIQEIILVSDNDEEKCRVNALQRNISKSKLNKLDLDVLDKLFSNKSSVQNIRAAGVSEVKCEKMNVINNFVTSGYIEEVRYHKNSHPRIGTVIETGCGVEHVIVDKLIDSFEIKQSYGHSDCDQLWKYMILEMIPFEVPYDLDLKAEEEINHLPSEPMAKFANQVLSELNFINEKLDKYIEEVSMPAKEFFGLLSDETNQKLDEFIKLEKEIELRESQCVRQSVNVDLSFHTDIELKALDDIEDVKKTIMQKVQKQLNNSIRFGLISDRDIQFKNIRLNGVELTSELKEVA